MGRGERAAAGDWDGGDLLMDLKGKTEELAGGNACPTFLLRADGRGHAHLLRAAAHLPVDDWGAMAVAAEEFEEWEKGVRDGQTNG